MPSRSYQRTRRLTFPAGNSFNFIYELENTKWTNSPRVNGRLILRSNTLNLRKQTWDFLSKGSFTTLSTTYNAGGSLRSIYSKEIDPVLDSLYNQAYGKLRGKLYKGNASLGVTVAGYAQSRSMVVQRYQQLTNRVERVSMRILRSRSRRARARAIASTHLEIIFGWIPLLNDIHAACSSVIQGADSTQFVSGRAAGSARISRTGGSPRHLVRGFANMTVTLSSRVVITNPNRWLAERAGLLNPVAVAWDVVPWSFVVNMFVNTGSLVNSITDFAGLSFPDASTTKTVVTTTNSFCWTPGSKTPDASNTISKEKWKARGLSSFPAPSLEFKIPDASWESAAMAASLFVQKFSRLVPLLGR